MRKQIFGLTVVITLLLNGIAFAGTGDAYESDALTGDPRLACEAILCLSQNGTKPTECNKSLKKYFSIKKRRSSKTKKARKKFLELCPKTDEEQIVTAIENTTEESIAENEFANEAAEEAAESTPTEIIEPFVFGLLWEPASENDQNLAVFLGTAYGLPRVNILDEHGNIIESGRYEGRADDSRPIYRFNLPGGEYPDPCFLQIGKDVLLINNPSQNQRG